MSRLDKKRGIGLLLCLGAAVVLVAGWTWARSHGATSTDNAYIRGDVTSLAPKVASYVTAVEVEDSQTVRAGDVLFRIDDRDYRAQVEQAAANVEADRARLANVDAETQLQHALIRQAEAQKLSAMAEMSRATRDSDRRRELIRSNAVSYDLLIVISALGFLILMAYRGYSVILFAPIAAMLAVLLTEPEAVPAAYSGIFLEKMVAFIKLYFPVFLLGAIFGKVIELSGFSEAIAAGVIRVIGAKRAMLSIVMICAILTYGGVSLFVVVFAAYPFAAEMFRKLDIPKRLIPGTIALGAFSFTMDAFPGSPQIQNIIPTTFFNTNSWAAPWLGLTGTAFILVAGMSYLEWRRRRAEAAGEGYGAPHELMAAPVSATSEPHRIPSPWIAVLPLIVVGVINKILSGVIPSLYGQAVEIGFAGSHQPTVVQVSPVVAVWAIEGALLAGIATVLLFAFRAVNARFAEGSKEAVAGSLLASLNTASEYGFGASIAALPGFLAVKNALLAIPNPLINEAIAVTTLAGVTGSASGGMSIALGAMADRFIAAATTAGIPLEVMHRVAAMASGGMDTLPHNGAVITLLAVCGLTHRQSYRDIFAVTCIKTLAVFFVIATYYTTGLV